LRHLTGGLNSHLYLTIISFIVIHRKASASPVQSLPGNLEGLQGAPVFVLHAVHVPGCPGANDGAVVHVGEVVEAPAV